MPSLWNIGGDVKVTVIKKMACIGIQIDIQQSSVLVWQSEQMWIN
jgi:hypothetical protein